MTTKTGLVRFADTAQLHIYSRQEEHCGKNDVAFHELWYTAADFRSMRRTFEQDVRRVRAQGVEPWVELAAVPFNNAGNDGDTTADENSVCYVGIESFLTVDLTLERAASREQCINAVLEEQARQEPSARFKCEAIALASSTQTREVVRRARMLGHFHQDSI